MKIYQNVQTRKHIQEKHKQDQPNFKSWQEHQRGRSPNPLKSPPGEGGVGRRQPECGRTLGVATPPLPPLEPTLQEAVQLMSL